MTTEGKNVEWWWGDGCQTRWVMLINSVRSDPSGLFSPLRVKLDPAEDLQRCLSLLSDSFCLDWQADRKQDFVCQMEWVKGRRGAGTAGCKWSDGSWTDARLISSRHPGFRLPARVSAHVLADVLNSGWLCGTHRVNHLICLMILTAGLFSCSCHEEHDDDVVIKIKN